MKGTYLTCGCDRSHVCEEEHRLYLALRAIWHKLDTPSTTQEEREQLVVQEEAARLAHRAHFKRPDTSVEPSTSRL